MATPSPCASILRWTSSYTEGPSLSEAAQTPQAEIAKPLDQAVGRQFGNVDWGQGARLEQHALMDCVARGARRDVLGGDDFRFDAARRDLGG